ncbi:MAG: alpha/beta hydrolase [Kouleothrix sp.]|nr:alpha/beta hydrolase [Kouleothrix sp.]
MSDDQSARPAAPAWATWALSIVNGAVGDYLSERDNGLSIDMAFYHGNRPLPLTPEALQRAYPQPTTKICVLIHGLGCNEGIWLFHDPARPGGETSYGAMLQADLGFTPFFVRYNTGLSIADNGRRLATLLGELLACYPAPVEEIALIGHSMGGLVLRSACHDAAESQAGWVEQVTQVFYLGTPHQGASLAQLGHVATEVLRAVPHPITRLIGSIFNLRSRGVKDLRFGRLLDAETPARDVSPDDRWDVPWLAHAHHHLIAGTLTDDPLHAVTALFGDGLVRVGQAHGHGDPPTSGHSVRLFPGIHHLQLTRDPDIYQQIRHGCTSV